MTILVFTPVSYIAVASGVVFICQIILSLNGMCPFKINPKEKGDFSLSRHQLKLLIIKNTVGFIFAFSWFLIMLRSHIFDLTFLVILSAAISIMFIALVYPLLNFVCKRGERNSFNMEETEEKLGEVYITIPAENKGKGKIIINTRGQFWEYDAITFSEKPIVRGKIVTIIGIENSVMIVVPI